MKKLIIILFSLVLTSGLWAQKAFSAKITSKDNSEFFVKENNGNYFVTFEIDNINAKQLNTLESNIKNSRGVLTVTTSEIDTKTYFFKVEFYKFATSKRYYAGFFKRNNIKKLLIDDKVIYPDDLIEKK